MTTTANVIDFDHRSAHYRDNWEKIADDLHATGNAIAWSEAHGGFWVVGSWEGVQQVGTEWESFTSVNDLNGTENGGKGQRIPQNSYRLYLGESDPPLHTERRRLEVPFFTPRAIRKWEPVARQFLDEAINAVIETGHADLINDIILPVTARTTLYVVGYPADDWQDAAAAAHRGAYTQPHEPTYPHAEQARLRTRFREILQSRQGAEGTDVISSLANGSVFGEPLSLDEGESMMNALVFGGFDTTMSATARSLVWLDQHPEEAERIRTDRDYRLQAIEELLRYFTPPAGMGRTAVQDIELMGQQIKKGDSVYMWLAGANRDPQKFENPNTIDLTRANARDNIAFSTGAHRCLGSPLAKIELSMLLSEIPSRLQNLRIEHDKIVRYPTIGGVNGISLLPATFTPGTPSSPESASTSE
ncbi:cytochrome P450 [Arthrobacter sp. SAFR-044]|uniref:cytochrome P450 n=1 Tax=Arthrobacter sp. SAFR-044 TaxID=3387278 RepID=UPI003F7B7812